MNSSASLIKPLFLCAVFFFLGFLFYPLFYQFALPGVTGIQYNIDLTTLGKKQDLFGMVIAMIPVFLLLTWRLIPLYDYHKKTFSALIVLVCMAFATYLRHKILAGDFTNMVQSQSDTSYMIDISFEQLDFEWYLAGGLVSGCLISYLAFHNTRVKRKQFVRIEP